MPSRIGEPEDLIGSVYVKDGKVSSQSMSAILFRVSFADTFTLSLIVSDRPLKLSGRRYLPDSDELWPSPTSRYDAQASSGVEGRSGSRSKGGYKIICASRFNGI